MKKFNIIYENLKTKYTSNIIIQGLFGSNKQKVQKISDFLNNILIKQLGFKKIFSNNTCIFVFDKNMDFSKDALYLEQPNSKYIILDILNQTNDKMTIIPYAFYADSENEILTTQQELHDWFTKNEDTFNKQNWYKQMADNYYKKIKNVDPETQDKLTGKFIKSVYDKVNSLQKNKSIYVKEDEEMSKHEQIIIKTGDICKKIIEKINDQLKNTGLQLDVKFSEDKQKDAKKAAKKAQRDNAKKELKDLFLKKRCFCW